MNTKPAPGVLERAIDNASCVVKSLLPGDLPDIAHRSPGDVVTAAICLLALTALGSVAPGANSFAVPVAVAATFLAICLAGALIFRRQDRVGHLAVGLIWALAWGQLAALGLGVALAGFGEGVALVAAIVPVMFATLFALACIGPLKGGAAGLVAAIPALLVALPAPETLPVDPSAGFDLPAPEIVFSRQSTLLDDQIASLSGGDPAVPDLFAIVGAGHPYQRVFLRETDAVVTQMQDRFALQGRVISLANSAHAPLDHPLLTRQNLAASAEAIGARMSPEDILLVFLTSHGQVDQLDTVFTPFIPYALTPGDVASALKAAGDPLAVVVVSACYSGSFADELAAPNRLVLTAADTDSVSFGCDDQNEWTAWGQAFWVDALADTHDFRLAARLAQDLVKLRESELEYPASDPMILEGALIGPALDRWLSTLP